jgi:hypothetical protein
VPTAAIVDIDIINNQTIFRDATSAFDLDWKSIEQVWRTVYQAVQGQKSGFKIAQIKASIRNLLEDFENDRLSLEKLVGALKDYLQKTNPWDQVKLAGRSGLPVGDAVSAYDRLRSMCAEVGLWILNVGELEGFCKSETDKKGAAWVEAVLQTRDLGQDAELADARELLTGIKASFSRAKAVP